MSRTTGNLAVVNHAPGSTNGDYQEGNLYAIDKRTTRGKRGKGGKKGLASMWPVADGKRGERERVTKEDKLRRVLTARVNQGFMVSPDEKRTFVEDMLAYLLQDWHTAEFKPLRSHRH